MTTELVPIEILSKRLHVSVPLIRVWVRRGVIPKGTYMLEGRTYRFDVEGVIAHMLNNEPIQGEQNVG